MVETAAVGTAATPFEGAMEGVVTIVQESRFQITDAAGVSHLFLLGPHAGAEPAQLAPLQRRQARVRVTYRQSPNMLGLLATSLSLAD